MLKVLVYKLLDAWSLEELMNYFSTIQIFYKHKRDLMLKSLNKHFKVLIIIIIISVKN